MSDLINNKFWETLVNVKETQAVQAQAMSDIRDGMAKHGEIINNSYGLLRDIKEQTIKHSIHIENNTKNIDAIGDKFRGHESGHLPSWKRLGLISGAITALVALFNHFKHLFIFNGK